MAARKQPLSLYDQVVAVTHIYLGPAADRFIARQVQNHLHKSPAQLSQKDLLSLIDWIRAVVALLTDRNDIIEEYTAELQKLAANAERPKNSKGQAN